MGKRYALLLVMVALLHNLTGCATNRREHTILFEKSENTHPQAAVTSLEFPYTLPDSGLVAEGLVAYNGPYWEDGSGDNVQGVAALMLYNPGDRMVEFGGIAIQQGDAKQYYFVYHLPPKSRCLVPEKSRMPYGKGSVTACLELRVWWEYPELSRERLHYVGFGEKLTITNLESRQQSHITLWYKRYVAEGDYYLGGVSYSAHTFFLQPQECRSMTPEYYDAANARVVSIRIG